MDEIRREWIIFIYFETILGFLIVFCNATILIAIKRKRSLHTVTSVFVGNLATADLLVGMTIGPLSVLNTLKLPKVKLGCIFTYTFIGILTNVSIITLLSVTVERFIAIRWPYFYIKSITVPRSFKAVGGIWVFGISLALACVDDWNDLFADISECRYRIVISEKRKLYIETGAIIVAPIGIMICIYSYILTVVKRHAQKSVVSNQGSTLSQVMAQVHKLQAIREFSKQARGVKMFAVLILAFTLLWLPLHVINFLFSFCGHNDSSCLPPQWIVLGVIVLSHIHSCTNPIICAASDKVIIDSIRNMFCTLRHGDFQTSGETSEVSRLHSLTTEI